MRLCVIFAARFDSEVATLCFCFEQTGYRIVLLLAHDADLACSSQQAGDLELAACIEKCEMDDSATLQSTMEDIRTRHGVPDVLIGHRLKEITWLSVMQAFSPARLILVLEQPAATAPAMQAAGFNTILVAHAGALALPLVSEEEPLALVRQRGGRAYEVAMLALYLASSEAAHIHGATMTVHSGRYLS